MTPVTVGDGVILLHETCVLLSELSGIGWAYLSSNSADLDYDIASANDNFQIAIDALMLY